MTASNSPLRYEPGEISIPGHLDANVGNWIGLSWDLQTPSSNRRETIYAHYIVLPGLSLVRTGFVNKDTWKLDPSTSLETYTLRSNEVSSTPLARAIDQTQRRFALSNSSWTWETKPYLFSIDPEMYPNWDMSYVATASDGASETRSIATMGDAFAYGSDQIRCDIFETMLNHRRALRR